MKKRFIFFLIFFLIFFIVGFVFSISKIQAYLAGDDPTSNYGTSTTSSGTTGTGSNSNGVFGGQIVETKASQIKSLEDEGYSCSVSGTSIEIKSTKGPTSYLIPSGTTSKTKYQIRANQWILGKYNGKTTITCTRDEEESTVTLDTITLFGTSK